MFAAFAGDPFAANGTAGLSALASGADGTKLDSEQIWALAHCDCMAGLTARFFKAQAVQPGALPQILVPEVREEIRNDGSLKALAALPRFLSPVTGLLKGVLASDEKIAAKVRASLAARLAKSLPGGTRLGEQLEFRFDLFKPLAPAGTGVAGFATVDQAARWALVLGLESMWTRDAPLAFADDGLQLLQTVTVLTEWKYLFGLKDAASDPAAGGLMVRKADGIAGKPGALDPRREAVGAFASGNYTVTVGTGSESAVDAALDAQETWARGADALPLGEQAMILADAAQAFKRLRPEARGRVGKLFAAGGGLIPDNAQELPLAFLAVIGPLLDGGFIDADARAIYGIAALGGAPAATPRKPASLLDLTRFARALDAWVVQLESIDAATPDADQRAKLATARDSLKRALQLVVQIILRDHVSTRAVTAGDGAIGSALWLAFADGPEALGVAGAAEALATLADVETGALESPFLRGKVLDLAHGFAAHELAGLAAAGTVPSTSAVLWSLTALRAVARAAGDDAARMTWLDGAQTALRAAVAAADAAGAAP